MSNESSSSQCTTPDTEIETVLLETKSNCCNDRMTEVSSTKSANSSKSNLNNKKESEIPIQFGVEYWQDGTRRSAFSPYRINYRTIILQPSTILTNLQRGNVKTETTPVVPDLSIHQLAAKGEFFPDQLDADLEELDSNGFTPLMWACAYGQLPVVNILLEKGVCINTCGRDGENCLLLASNNGHSDILKLLIERNININHKDTQGNTALMYAAYNNHAQCVQELLKHGADITIENDQGETAYNAAVTKGSKQAQAVIEKHILLLLEHSS